MRPADKRKRRSRKEAYRLLAPLKEKNIIIDSVIQCGLGDWAEGPVLLDLFPDALYMAAEPLHRYCHETWAAGFKGPIIQGVLWSKTGEEKKLHDWRTRTSVYDEAPHGLGSVAVRTITLDDAVRCVGFSGKSSLLWQDCEGAELEILKGAEQTLKSVQAIICELKRGTPFPEWPTRDVVIDEIELLGFELVKEVSSNGLFLRK